jgi:hypothetical protein
MWRRLFNIISFISLTLFMIAALATWGSYRSVKMGPVASAHWDIAQQQWIFDPPASKQDLVKVFLVSLAAAFGLAILPLCWLRRSLKKNLRLNRLWRGQCRSCGYNLRRMSQRCPECGVVVEFETGEPPGSDQQMPPGTQANLNLLAIVPAAAIMAAIIVGVLIYIALCNAAI